MSWAVYPFEAGVPPDVVGAFDGFIGSLGLEIEAALRGWREPLLGAAREAGNSGIHCLNSTIYQVLYGFDRSRHGAPR
jgi:hypothetical protein